MKKLLRLIALFPALAAGQTLTQNYIKSTTYKVQTTSSISSPQASQAVQSVTYFDGLGRPMQQVASKQSSEGKDIVTHIEYDALGRQALEFLPYPSQESTMSFTDPSVARHASLAHYQAEFGDANPFSEKRFEASPLNRVLQQAAPGNAWALGAPGQADHSIKIGHETNSIADKVKLYRATAGPISGGFYPEALGQTGYHAPSQLYKTVTKDENWTSGKAHTSEEFKNKEGQVVLKRTYGESVVGNSMLFTAHDTYYVYDQYGNLSFVLPPMSDGSGAAQDLDGLCYQYRYDHRNRLVEKKLPGKNWEFIIYDKLDRVAATGPAPTPFPDDQQGIHGWMVTKYDAFGRTVLTGWMPVQATSAERNSLQNDLNSHSGGISEKRTPSVSTLNGVSFKYTNNSWPASMHVLTVSYYDDYNFPGAPQAVPASVAGGSQPVYYSNAVKPKGLPTGSWTRALEGISSYGGASAYILYDGKARPVRIYSSNYLGGYTQADSRIDFSGKTLYTVTEHKRTAADAALTVREDFSYTDQDRLLAHTHEINGGSVQLQLLARNEYGKLGELKTKSLGGTDISGTGAMQKVDYSYNIRGWLKGINAGIPDPADLFVFELKYDSPESAQALFNGNISETFWKSASDMVRRKYGYAYDAMNRLRGASYFKTGQSVAATHAYDEALQYDTNGNITHLWRNGNNDGPVPFEIDNLAYAYDPQLPNRLLSVTDDSLDPVGFFDGSKVGNDYTYDDYGNMTSDANKGIQSITYNHLNLPAIINFGSGNRIDYLYDATGKKLKKTVWTSSKGKRESAVMDYLDGFQHANGTLLFFRTAEGYVSHVSGAFNYVYNYTDHLGNIRLSYGTDPQTNALRIIEESHYYPFGMKHANYNVDRLEYQGNPGGVILEPVDPAFPFFPKIRFGYNYKYNGKEWQDELGLNMTAMDYRQYDNAIGRFNSVDALAEMQYSNTPYHFSGNNPVFFSDPSGLIQGGPMLNAMWDNTASGTNSFWQNDGSGLFMNENKTAMIDAYSGEYTSIVSLLEVEITVDRRNWRGAGALAQMHVYRNSSYYDSFWRDMRRGQLDSFQRDLDYMGTVPGLGEPADALNAVISAFRGDYTGAGLSALAMVPFAGNLATATKIGRRADNVATTAFREFSGTTKAVGNGLPNSSYEYLAPNGNPISKHFYNDAGKVNFEINYKPHNMGGVHGHSMSIPGSINSGHLPENHIPFMLIPKKYF